MDLNSGPFIQVQNFSHIRANLEMVIFSEYLYLIERFKRIWPLLTFGLRERRS